MGGKTQSTEGAKIRSSAIKIEKDENPEEVKIRTYETSNYKRFN